MSAQLATLHIPYPHIEIGAGSVPLIAGTTMKVVELVLAQRAHGWSPEELHFQFPFLGMSQIHAALTYFWDHQEEIEADIRRRDLRADELRAKLSVPDSLLARLKSRQP